MPQAQCHLLGDIVPGRKGLECLRSLGVPVRGDRLRLQGDACTWVAADAPFVVAAPVSYARKSLPCPSPIIRNVPNGRRPALVPNLPHA